MNVATHTQPQECNAPPIASDDVLAAIEGLDALGVQGATSTDVARVSVIIPTHDRPLHLRRLLETLAAQTYPAEAMEVIVAQDGGDERTMLAIDEAGFPKGANIGHIRHERGSAAATRNLGASVSTGKYLLFVDDDCGVDAHWVERTVAVFEADPDVGEVASRIASGSSRFFARCHDFARYYPSMAREPGERSFACGCAFGIRRSIFEELGGFDESIKTGEDEDLGLRMQALGRPMLAGQALLTEQWHTVHRPACVVYHHHGRTTLRAMLQRAYAWGARGEVDRHLMHRKRSVYGRFASANPYFYLVLAPLISLAVTLRIWRCAWREPMMPLYIPFIYCDKIAWCWATFGYLRSKEGRV